MVPVGTGKGCSVVAGSRKAVRRWCVRRSTVPGVAGSGVVVCSPPCVHVAGSGRWCVAGGAEKKGSEAGGVVWRWQS